MSKKSITARQRRVTISLVCDKLDRQMLLNNEVNKKDIESVKAVKILLAGVLYEQNLHSAIKLHRNIC